MSKHLPIFILSGAALLAVGGLGVRTVVRSTHQTIARMDQSDFRSDLAQNNLNYILDGDQTFPGENSSELFETSSTEGIAMEDFSGLIEVVSERALSQSATERETAENAVSDYPEEITVDEEIIDLESELFSEEAKAVSERMEAVSEAGSEMNTGTPSSAFYDPADYPVPADHRVIFVGDSRTVGAHDALVDTEDQCVFIGETGEGHAYLVERALPALYDAIADYPDAAVVFNLGVNDCENITLYLDTYEQVLADFPDTRFYFMSVNPVTEDSEHVTNDDIKAFNRVLRAVFPDRYIDTYTWMTEGGFISTDGVHYAHRQYEAIHDYAVRAVLDLPQPAVGLQAGETTEE